MNWKEEDCWIYWDRPLKKMEKRIKKLTSNPSADLLECRSWSGVKFRENVKSEDIQFLGSVTKNQIRNVRSILTGSSPSDSAYKSHRKGYVFSDKEKKLSKEVKEKCKDKVCAVVVQSDRQSDERHIIKSYIIGDVEIPDDVYELKFVEKQEGDWRIIQKEFSDLLDVKSFLESMKGKKSSAIVSPYLKKLEHYRTVDMITDTEETVYDHVKYFQIS